MPDDVLVASDTRWIRPSEGVNSSNLGWFIEAQRVSDGAVFLFLQRISDEGWRQYYGYEAHCSQSDAALLVCAVRWPEPSSRSLGWAVSALLNDQLPNGKRHLAYDRVYEALAAVPLEVGLSFAIEWLLVRGISDPAAQLRERGFDI